MHTLRLTTNTMFDRVRTLVLPLVLLGLLTASPAIAQKIGYTNQEAILSNMPEMQEVQKTLKQEAQQQQRQLRRQQQKFQKQLKQYQQQRSLLSDSAQSAREQELQQMRTKLQRSSQQRQQQLRKRERELMQPLLEDLQSAIDTVAAARNIDMVVRTQALLYVNQQSESVTDITRDVAQELGISLQDPGEPSPTVEPTSTPPSQGGRR